MDDLEYKSGIYQTLNADGENKKKSGYKRNKLMQMQLDNDLLNFSSER